MMLKNGIGLEDQKVHPEEIKEVAMEANKDGAQIAMYC